MLEFLTKLLQLFHFLHKFHVSSPARPVGADVVETNRTSYVVEAPWRHRPLFCRILIGVHFFEKRENSERISSDILIKRKLILYILKQK